MPAAREVRLGGIEPAPFGSAALSATLTDKNVSLRGTEDPSDRYANRAFVFLGTPSREYRRRIG